MPCCLSNRRRPTAPNSPTPPCPPGWSPWTTVRQTTPSLTPPENTKVGVFTQLLKKTHNFLSSSSSTPAPGCAPPLHPRSKALGALSAENLLSPELKLNSGALTLSLLPPPPRLQSSPPWEKKNGWMKPPFCCDGFTQTLFP